MSKDGFEDLGCDKVYISAMRNGYLTINKITAERGNIIRHALKNLLHRIDRPQCKEVHIFMNSMFSVWACEDIADFKNRPKVVLHIPEDEIRDNVPMLSIKRAYLLLKTAEDVTVSKVMYDGLTDKMLFITYTGEHDKLFGLPAKKTVDLKELVDNLYRTNFSRSAFPF